MLTRYRERDREKQKRENRHPKITIIYMTSVNANRKQKTLHLCKCVCVRTLFSVSAILHSIQFITSVVLVERNQIVERLRFILASEHH